MTVELVQHHWGKVLRDALLCDHEKFLVVCPFIKRNVLRGLIADCDITDLRVLTRFNLADFASGVSDIEAIRAVLEAGGRVRGVQDLHAKVFVFGSSQAAVTSANLTSRGTTSNHEFGCISSDAAFVSSCVNYAETLWSGAGDDVTEAHLKDWEKVVRHHLETGARPAWATGLPDHGTAVDAGPEPSPVVPRGGWAAASGQAFVKFFGQGSNRAPRSMSTLEEVERTGCHWACTYPDGKRPRQVDDGDTLFVGRLVSLPDDLMIFGRVIGLAHRGLKDDASPEEVAARPFKAAWPHYIRVHSGEFVAGDLANGVSLRELMDELGAEAFESTRRNLMAGRGNTIPQLAVRQQPQVQLSAAATSWVTARLEAMFGLHGTIPAAELEKLDWPES